jgi:transposase
VLKTFGLLPGAMRGLRFDRKVEVLLEERSDVAPIVRPMLVAWRQLREQISAVDNAIRVLGRSNSPCRVLMSAPGIGVLSALAYVSTVEDPARFSQSHLWAHIWVSRRDNINPKFKRSSGLPTQGCLVLNTTPLFRGAG